MEGCKVLDLWIVFWVVLAFNSQTMTGGFFFAEGEGGGKTLRSKLWGIHKTPSIIPALGMEPNQWKILAILLFYKKVNSAS